MRRGPFSYFTCSTVGETNNPINCCAISFADSKDNSIDFINNSSIIHQYFLTLRTQREGVLEIFLLAIS